MIIMVNIKYYCNINVHEFIFGNINICGLMRKLEDELDQEDEMFSSPIQGIELSNKRTNNGSPSEMTIQFCQSGSFKKIVEKENEDES